MADDLVAVPVPGRPEAVFIVRRPDPVALILSGWAPSPLWHDAVGLAEDDPDQIQWIRAESETAVDVQHERLNAWVCACAVDPRIVPDDAPEDDALRVSEVSLALRLAIQQATYPAVAAAAQRRAAAARTLLSNDVMVAHLDATARRYGQRPSTLVGIAETSAVLAIDFDLAVAARSQQLTPRS